MENSTRNPMRNLLLLWFLVLHCLASLCLAGNNITSGKYIRDGETLISNGEKFALGFFSPGNSTLRYVGIWYHKITTPKWAVVWVANREAPISDKSGVLTIRKDGNLVVLDGRNVTVWSSNVSVRSNSMAKLNDDGNLILSSRERIEETDTAFWQSFNHPTDTFLPGMRVRFNASTGVNPAFVSWKSPNDPSPGNFTMGIDPRGAPQVVIWRASERRWRTGYWDNQKFNGVPNMSSLLLFGFKLNNEGGDNLSFEYIPMNHSDPLMFKLAWNGFEEQVRWEEGNQSWVTIQRQPQNECEFYNRCGNFGICRITSNPICSCIEGFVPKHQEQWIKGNWSGGCERSTPLQCQRNVSLDNGDGDEFRPIKNVKLPDFADQMVAGDRADCRNKCLRNCSCTAYAYEDGINCMMWMEDLIDIQRFPAGGGTLYLRLAASELGQKSKLPTVAIVIIAVAGATILGVMIWLLWKFKAKSEERPTPSSIPHLSNMEAPIPELSMSKEISSEFSGPNDPAVEGDQVSGPELPMFSFNYVALATDNFSDENKLGKGGFGPVYKGKLQCGAEIAVKRLSRRSGQGLGEFKNEIKLIAKLQHRNLVRLLGCCVEGEEYMLLYEYMPNKSLDFFLFEPTRQVLLDWKKRYTIVEGIARGLLYLHRDSRLRIIHRDLKASNILLDEDMNPKISDFGIARIFGGNENEANTVRVVGTYGYMSPEYAMEGLFSVKSDVYSFGVLTLEIVSGRRNTSFRSSDHANLIGYAWDLWNEGRAIDMVDPTIRESCSTNEVLRCIHIGMLCVQDSATARPTMSNVVVMLESEDATLPQPKQPTYTSVRHSIDTDSNIEAHDSATINDMTITTIHGR